MSWKEDVLSVIRENYSVGDIFNLQDIYSYNNHFKSIYSNNNNIEAKVRQTLQYLRNDGILEFVDDNGTFRLLK